MGWDNNPFNNMELVKGEKGWKLHCHNCGWDDWFESNVLSDLYMMWTNHITQSHKNSRMDFSE